MSYQRSARKKKKLRRIRKMQRKRQIGKMMTLNTLIWKMKMSTCQVLKKNTIRKQYLSLKEKRMLQKNNLLVVTKKA
jgi:hypothetical protein